MEKAIQEVGKHAGVKQFIDHGFTGFTYGKKNNVGISSDKQQLHSYNTILMPLQRHRRCYCVLKMHSISWMLIKVVFNQLIH